MRTAALPGERRNDPAEEASTGRDSHASLKIVRTVRVQTRIQRVMAALPLCFDLCPGVVPERDPTQGTKETRTGGARRSAVPHGARQPLVLSLQQQHFHHAARVVGLDVEQFCKLLQELGLAFIQLTVGQDDVDAMGEYRQAHVRR